MSALVTYQTTRPRKSDTRWIVKQKWLQIQRSGGLDGGLDKTVVYPDTEVRFHDTKKITLDKILQEQQSEAGSGDDEEDEGDGGGGEEGTELAIVQVESFFSTVQNPATYEFGFISQATAGNLLVLVVVSDTTIAAQDGWILAEDAVDATGTYIFYKIADGSEQNFVITPNSQSPGCCCVVEIEGCSATPLDKTASATGQSGSTPNTGTTAVTAQDDEICIALIGISLAGGDADDISSWSDGFIQQANVVSSGGVPANVRLGIATKIISAAAAMTTTATLSQLDDQVSGAIATFKKAA